MSGLYPKSMRKKSSHGLIRSFQKELSYIECVITKPVTVNFKKRTYHLQPAKHWKISRSIYERRFSCMDYPGCDLCCAGCWSLFLDNITSEGIKNSIPHKEYAEFNGEKFLYHCSDHANPQSDCQFLVNGCSVHSENPITCMFPLIKFQKRGDTVYVFKSYFSRNWIIKCPVKFSKYNPKEEWYNDTMWKFERFQIYMDHLKIDNILKKMIFNLKYQWTGELSNDI